MIIRETDIANLVSWNTHILDTEQLNLMEMFLVKAMPLSTQFVFVVEL